MLNRKKILMTGVSGFFGSALAANFLKQTEPPIILSLSENDQDGSKARTAIQQYFHVGTLDLTTHLQHIYCPNLNHVDTLHSLLKDVEVDEVWHVGARMSYNFLEMNNTIRDNSIASVLIMNALASCKRYYFISTTGVAGVGDREKQVPEDLLLDFDAVNPYTISKLLAEYMLSKASEENEIPLTIIRPGSMIGDSQTGWAGKTRYGYYSFLHALKKFQNKDMTFYFDIDPDKKFPVIHIDHLVQLCQTLSNRSQARNQEIFHAINDGLMTAREHFSIFKEVIDCKVKVDFGPGEAGFNKVYNEMNKDNNHFMGVKWNYANDKLIAYVGINNILPSLSKSSLANVFHGYFNSKLGEK